MTKRALSAAAIRAKDDEVRRASHYPVGRFHPVDIKHWEDEERAKANMGGTLATRIGFGHNYQAAVEFRRTEADSRPGKPSSVMLNGPPPNRPRAGASPEEIKRWNAYMDMIPPEQRILYMGVPGWWLLMPSITNPNVAKMAFGDKMKIKE